MTSLPLVFLTATSLAEKNKGPARANPERGLDAARPSAFCLLYYRATLAENSTIVRKNSKGDHTRRLCSRPSLGWRRVGIGPFGRGGQAEIRSLRFIRPARPAARRLASRAWAAPPQIEGMIPAAADRRVNGSYFARRRSSVAMQSPPCLASARASPNRPGSRSCFDPYSSLAFLHAPAESNESTTSHCDMGASLSTR
jgi:hypothetical protein